MSQDNTAGASNNQRLLYAARSDDENMILDILGSNSVDINFQDGLGNTALHYAASQGSTSVLEHILEHDECDVDPVNRIEKETPLHLALGISDPTLKGHVVKSLLDAGAQTTIRNKHGQDALDLVPRDDVEIADLIRKARAEASISQDDIADDENDDDLGSGSGSDDED